MVAAARVALAVTLALVGCKKSAENDKGWIPDPNAPATLTEPEIKRGKDACAAYRDNICKCSEAHADRKDIGEACKLAKGYPEALEIGLNMINGVDTEKRDVHAGQNIVRKTMAKCIEEASKLTLLGCD